MRHSRLSGIRVRSRITWRHRLDRVRGSATVFDLRCYDAALDEISRFGRDVSSLSDAAITEQAQTLRASAKGGTPLADVRGRLFALAREAAERTLSQRPFDGQVVAALALDAGTIVEMQTGEGKTLAAVMPAALHALAGRGVHVLTFNDYLARRDAEWMDPIYRPLDVSVASVHQGMTMHERQQAYRADVTYVTAKEAGFDYLRDGLSLSPAEQVQRQRYSAILDEADSLLIDEARMPLVVAGAVNTGGGVGAGRRTVGAVQGCPCLHDVLPCGAGLDGPRHDPVTIGPGRSRTGGGNVDVRGDALEQQGDATARALHGVPCDAREHGSTSCIPFVPIPRRRRL